MCACVYLCLCVCALPIHAPYQRLLTRPWRVVRDSSRLGPKWSPRRPANRRPPGGSEPSAGRPKRVRRAGQSRPPGAKNRRTGWLAWPATLSDGANGAVRQGGSRETVTTLRFCGLAVLEAKLDPRRPKRRAAGHRCPRPRCGAPQPPTTCAGTTRTPKSDHLRASPNQRGC